MFVDVGPAQESLAQRDQIFEVQTSALPVHTLKRPLWQFNIAMENHHFNTIGNSKNGSRSIAMFNYQGELLCNAHLVRYPLGN